MTTTLDEIRKRQAERRKRDTCHDPRWLDEIDALLRVVDEQTSKLAECYRLAGADTDGNEEWRYAPNAPQAVAELRKDYDEACGKQP